MRLLILERGSLFHFPGHLGLNLIYLISFNRSSCFFDRLPVLLINTTDILDCLFLLQWRFQIDVSAAQLTKSENVSARI